MAESIRLPFEECARLSGLLSESQINELAEAVRARLGGELPDDPRVRGEKLGEEAVARGLLNAWQVKQLLEGRIKFTLGSYRVVDALGRGGGGQVFKGVHELLGREVAIKVLPRDQATPERVERFLQEIRNLALLDHPNLVRALDAGRDGGVYYLVLEYVPGVDLRRYVQTSGPLSEYRAATLIAQIALALDYAHRRGLIHRDVKPGNVLVTPDNRAKLADLGFASSVFDEEILQARQAKIAGTVDYLAPDHITAPWDPKPAWDIYSLGCTLYYAVTGRVPFPEGTTEEKIRAHLEKEPTDPRDLNPKISERFAQVIRQMMAKDPRERVASAQEVVLRLAPWIDPAVLPGEFALAVAGAAIGRVTPRSAEMSPEVTELPSQPVSKLADQLASATSSPPSTQQKASPGECVASGAGTAWGAPDRESLSKPIFPEFEPVAPSPGGVLLALVLFVVLPISFISLAILLSYLTR